MAKSFTKADFDFSKYLKSVDVGGYALRDIVRIMYACRRFRTKNGTMPLRHFYMRANVDLDYHDMDYLLDCNLMETKFDITFAYKILIENDVFGDVPMLQQMNEKLGENIRSLVKLRNDLRHFYRTKRKEFEDDVSLLENLTNLLKRLVTDIYNGASKDLPEIYTAADTVLHASVEDQRNKTINEIDEIFAANIMEDTTSFEEALKIFKEEKVVKLCHDGFHELDRFYDGLKTLNPCTWIDGWDNTQRFNLERTFTPPIIWSKKHQGNISLNEILQVEVKNKRMKSKEIPNVLLIKGHAGCGKTSLCRYIAHNWSKKLDDIKGLKNFNLVFLIDVSVYCSGNFFDHLREVLLRHTGSNFKAEDIKPILLDLNILFIIDGYDERSDRGSALVRDVFDNFHNHRIIVTTRNYYDEEIISIAKKFNIQLLLLELRGFDDVAQKDFSRKVFESVNKGYEDFWMYLDGRGRVLGEHLALPITISLLIVLWMENRKIVNKITTFTSLYYEIFTLFEEKLVYRVIVNAKGRGQKELKRKVSHLLFYLGKQAWTMLRDGFGCLLNVQLVTELERTCREKNIDTFEFLSAFLMCEPNYSGSVKSNENELHSKNYYFLHRTQMEYLTSGYLAQCIKDGSLNLDDIDQQVTNWERHSEVLVYLIGNMAKKNVLQKRELDFLRLVEKADIKSEDYCFWWKLISESHIGASIPDSPEEPIQYQSIKHIEIAEKINKEHLSRKDDWTLDSGNVAAGLRLMSLVSPDKLLASSLVIQTAKDTDSFKIPDFYDAFCAVEYHWRTKKKRTRVQVELHLQDHDKLLTDKTSDKFLSALNGWAELENFTGSLCDIFKFSYYSKLKNIRCLVTKSEVLKSFVGISKSARNLRKLRITLGFEPTSCLAEEVVTLSDFRGDLELFVPNMEDNNLDWLIKIVKCIAGGSLKNLHLEYSKLTMSSLRKLVKSMNRIITQSLSITVPQDANEWSMEALEREVEFKSIVCLD